MNIGENTLGEEDVAALTALAHRLLDGAGTFDKSAAGDVGGGAVDGGGAAEGTDANAGDGLVRDGLNSLVHIGDSAVAGIFAVNFRKIRTARHNDAENLFTQSFF